MNVNVDAFCEIKTWMQFARTRGIVLLSLNDVWLKTIVRVGSNAYKEPQNKKKRKPTSMSFQGPTNWCKVPLLSVSKEE